MNGFDVADQNLISVGRSVERLASNLRFPKLGQAIKMHSCQNTTISWTLFQEPSLTMFLFSP